MRRRNGRGLGRTLSLLLAPVLAFGLVACGASEGNDNAGASGSGTGANDSAATGTGEHPRGGSVVVALNEGFAGSWPSGLDPATNSTGGANLPQNQAIFGGLFLLRSDKDGSNGHIVGNQAASGKLSPDAKTLTIKLKPGIKFSDGTPLNAQAVIWNFKRDTDSSCTCAPTWQLREKNPFTSPDPLTVVVHLSYPNAAILHSFPVSNINWMASPTAFKKMGAAKFKLKPVGAGPFTVVRNKLSSALVVKRNPNYFRENLPYLDKITFQSISSDQTAYQALLAGQADAYEGAETTPVIEQAQKSKLNVTLQPGSSPYLVHFNTDIPPFDNKKARQAVIHATNWKAISEGLFNGTPKVVYDFITPADLFYDEGAPPGPSYDLAKAKKLVKQVGGINVQLDTTGVYTAKQVMTALQSQWEKAGIHVTTKAHQLNGLIKRLNSGKWQVELATGGAWDPAVGVGIGFRFRSDSPYTGVTDPHLDQLLRDGVSTSDMQQRDKTYQKIANYISDKAYGMFGFAFPLAQFSAPGLHAPGLTTKMPAIAVHPGVVWGEAWLEKD